MIRKLFAAAGFLVLTGRRTKMRHGGVVIALTIVALSSACTRGLAPGTGPSPVNDTSDLTIPVAHPVS
jgi:hypothetical protein